MDWRLPARDDDYNNFDYYNHDNNFDYHYHDNFGAYFKSHGSNHDDNFGAYLQPNGSSHDDDDFGDL